MADYLLQLLHSSDVSFFVQDKNELFWVYCVQDDEDFAAIAQTFGQDQGTLQNNPMMYILVAEPPSARPLTCIGETG